MPGGRHDELVKILVKLGNILGFRTYSADKLERNYFNDLPKTLDKDSLTFVEKA